MDAADKKLIFSPGGIPISTRKGLVVLKVPVGIPLPEPQLISLLGHQTNSHVLVMPFEWEVMSGAVAQKTLDALHKAIHAIEAQQKKESGDKRS